MTPPPLIERKLHFVTGKGGVGKTTVAAALGLELARRGRRTLVVEMDSVGRVPALLGVTVSDRRAVEVDGRLWAQSIDGRTALEEYLGLIVPVKRVLAGVFQSRIYQYFVAAAPGLKELMTIGKVWYEATREEHGKPAWDAIVVDAPATGHGMQYLQMPQAARDTFGAGLVQREAARVVALLQNPTVTAVHVVTLAEEMPVTETLEACATLTGALALPVGAIIVNRLVERGFTSAAIRRLRDAALSERSATGALLASVADRAEEATGWAEINAHGLARLHTALPDRLVAKLPFLFVEEFERPQVAQLSRLLGSQLAPQNGDGVRP
jgi:anion-transporting  ArsA/GET3 family ATPase